MESRRYAAVLDDAHRFLQVCGCHILIALLSMVPSSEQPHDQQNSFPEYMLSRLLMEHHNQLHIVPCCTSMKQACT